MKHLPLFGPGPAIAFGQFALAFGALKLNGRGIGSFAKLEKGMVIFWTLGILFIAFGFYLDYKAKRTSRLFENVKENRLITTGIYSVVRNPVYTGAMMASIGITLTTCNLLFIVLVPILCYFYMTIILINTEEKWLRAQYGEAYEAYCKRVNRCIPWLPKKC